MKTFMRHSAAVVLVVAVFLPAAALAQTYSGSSTVPYDSGTTPTQWHQMGQWRQSSDLQQKIAALGDTAVQSLPMPVLFGVAPSDLTPNFGDPRTNHPHQGEDIMAVKGTPIVSPTAAVVLRLEQGATEGNGIYTANPGGETFVYYHLDHYAEGIAAGQVLQAGSALGYVGNTGDAAGGAAHVHFEIHDSSGTPTDPFPRLTAEFSPAQKISFLTAILGITADPVALSNFLVTNFRSTFVSDVQSNIALPPLINSALNTVYTTPALTRDLYYGRSGQDVLALQTFLNAHGFVVAQSGPGSVGNETSYFGPATRAAAIKFQLAHNIVPAVGYVGPITRAAMALV